MVAIIYLFCVIQVLKLSRERQRRRRSGKRNAGEEAASESGDGTYSLSTAVDKGKQHNIRLSEKRIHPIRLKIRRAKYSVSIYHLSLQSILAAFFECGGESY